MATKLLATLNNFSGGLNEKVEPNMIADTELAQADNVLFIGYQGKAIPTKRYGYIPYTVSALANPITKIYDFYKNDLSKEFIAVSNTTVYKDSAGSLSAIPFNTITALSSNDVQMLTYKDRDINDVVLLSDGGKLKVYNGTNVSEVTPHIPTVSNPTATPPVTGEDTDPGLNDLANLTNFRSIAIKKDRIFAAAHSIAKNRLSFCHHDPIVGYAVYDYWPSTFYFDVATDEGDQITALKVFRDNLVIFCNRSAWLLKGDGRTLQDYDLSRLNVPSGCIAPKSVKEVGNFLFYLSNDHVYAMQSTELNYVSAQIVSQNVEKTLKSISLADKQKAVGTFYDNKYYLSFPNGICLVYDTLLNAWTKWTNVKANSFLDRDGVLFFCADTGHIYQFDENTFSDDGQAITLTAALKRLDFNMPVQKKKIKKLWVIAKQYDALSSNFNVSANIDYVTVNIKDITTDQSLVWDEGNWDETYWDFVDVVKTTMKINESGENIQLIISNDVLNEPITIYGLVMQYTVKKTK